MKKTNFSIIILITFMSSVFGQETKDSLAIKYASTITAQDLSEYLHVLASDSLEGRETGQPGQKKAANYLASHFKENGLTPPVKTDSGQSYFQKFTLVKKEWGDVSIQVGGKKKKFLEDFYAVGDFNIPKKKKLPIEFVGYGIDAPNYSDYKNCEAKGKGVVLFMGEPVKDSISMITGTTNYSDWANDWKKKAATAKSKGAELVFIVVGNKDEDFHSRLKLLKNHIAAPGLGFKYKEKGSAIFIPISMAAEMLKTTPEKLLAAKETLGKANDHPEFESAKVQAKISIKETPVETENVLGFIEGTDLKEEVIVLTAHYDHLGIENGKIHYGADDDGSGTSAIMEIAEAFAIAKQNRHGPRRSILIMPVTAEEKGLMGSEYYTDHPVFPLKNTVANLNIDMIGRLDEAHEGNPNYVYIIGSNRLSSDLHEINEQANKTYTDLELDYKFNSFNDPNRFYYRSDHYNFAKNNIPIIFYFNGVHKDYHQPTDTVDKINFEKMENITQLVFHTAWELANRDERIEVNVK